MILFSFHSPHYFVTSSEYQDDDEYIPKNTSLVVKRVPAKTAATSLIARLRGGPHAQVAGRGAVAAGAAGQGPSDGAIFMPVKAEEAFVETTVRTIDSWYSDNHSLYRCHCHCSCGSWCCDDSNRDRNIAIISRDVIFVQIMVMFTNNSPSCFNYLPQFNCLHFIFNFLSRPIAQIHIHPPIGFDYPNHHNTTLIIISLQAVKSSSDGAQGQGLGASHATETIAPNLDPTNHHQLASSEVLTEEEQQALLMLGSTARQTGASSSASYRWGAHAGHGLGAEGAPGEIIKGVSRSMAGQAGRGGMGGRGGGSESYGAAASAYGSNYVCKRCGRPGHFVTNCPSKHTIDMPTLLAITTTSSITLQMQRLHTLKQLHNYCLLSLLQYNMMIENITIYT